jgi:LysM repeat protein
MKTSLRHLLWIGALLCTDVMGQTASYTVKPGDSLAKIARRHSCTAQELAKANGLKLNSLIHPGQTLKLPAKDGATAGSTSSPAADGSHTIQSGETLTAVSRRYNIPLDDLLAANPGINPKTLKVGQKIRLAAVAQPEPAPQERTATPASSTPPPTPAETVRESPPATETGTTEKPAGEAASAEPEAKVRTVMVDSEMTFGEFATQHGTDIQRLNELNGLDLTAATVLAKGSELYVPTQP